MKRFSRKPRASDLVRNLDTVMQELGLAHVMEADEYIKFKRTTLFDLVALVCWMLSVCM
jgi:hypothetical protein